MPSAFKQTATSAASTRSSKPDSRTAQQRAAGNRNKGGLTSQDAKNQAEDAAKSEVSTHLTEVDREWFNIRIRDLEEKLTRLALDWFDFYSFYNDLWDMLEP